MIVLIDKIKILIGDDIEETLVDIYIDRAVIAIINYLNNEKFTSEFIKEKYPDAIITMVENMYRGKDDKFVLKKEQGKRSIWFSEAKDSILSQEVRALLPIPYARMW